MRIILRQIKRFFDFLLGDLSDQIFWKYIHLLRKDWKDGYLDNDCLKQGHRDFLIDLITRNENIIKILELGCGDGINLRKIAKINPSFELVGVDINKFAIETGKSKIKNQNFGIELIIGNFKNLNKFKKNQFDIVFSDAALMYVDDKNIIRVLKEAFRISKAKLIICEQHTDKSSFYNDKWIHNYKKNLETFVDAKMLETHDIKNSNRTGDWAEFGKIIEVKKYN